MSVSAGSLTSLGHHESEAAVTDDPTRRERTAEQTIAGASPDALKAFTEMQARPDHFSVDEASRHRSWWRRLLRRS